MKKLRSFFCCLFVLAVFLPLNVHADMGPKPSVQVDLHQLPESPCYVTLLSQEKSTGPYSVSTDPVLRDSWLIERDPQPELAQKAWQAFRDYQDPDEFYFIEYFSRCEDGQEFAWTYYPPQTFKVLVWLPESNQFLCSEVLDRYAFDSYFTAIAADSGEPLAIHKSYRYKTELLSLAVRIAATLVLELLIALLFRLHGKALRCILWTNLVTQILLNLALNLINYRCGPLAFIFHYIWMELAVLLLEALLYKFAFPRCGEERPRVWLGYAAAANILSFVAGLLLARWIPGIF